MNKSKRIVITGLGTLNAIANNIPESVQALQKGFCGIKAIDLFDTADFRSKNGGQIRNFTTRDYIPRDFSIKRMSRADMLSFAATLEALRDADLYPLPDQLKESDAFFSGLAGNFSSLAYDRTTFEECYLISLIV